MQARQAQLSEILNQQRTITIPVYQRHYRWDRRQLKVLWIDILAQYKRLLDFEGVDEKLKPALYKSVGNHYMGTVVLAKRSQSETSYDVIDGQQRLASLSLLLCAIREAWYPIKTQKKPASLPADDTAIRQLRTTFNSSNLSIPSDEIGGLSVPRFRPHLRDRLAYDACVLYEGKKKLTSSDLGLTQETLILNAFGFFLSQIKMDSNRVAADPDIAGFADCFPLRWKLLRDVVSTRLRFVEVITDDVDDANAIFESLNAKGRGLEQIDLLKNYLFLLLHDDDRVLEHFWTPLTAALGGEDELGRFVWADLVSRGLSAPQSKLYPTKQQELRSIATDNLDPVFDELTRLRAEAKNYLAATDPSSNVTDESLRAALVDLQRAGGTTAVPLLLYIFRYATSKSADNEAICDAIRLVESYLVRRFLMGMDGHNLNSYFSTMLTKAHAEENELGLSAADGLVTRIGKVLDSVPTNWPTDDRLLTPLMSMPFYTHGESSQRMLVFKRLDHEYGQKYSINYSETDLTIEHILPQTPDSGGAWVASCAASGVAYEELKAEFGDSLVNLVPLLRTENSGVGNKEYELKSKVYATSSLKVTSDLPSRYPASAGWAEQQLRDRATELLARVSTAWPRPVQEARKAAPSVEPQAPLDIDEIVEPDQSAAFEGQATEGEGDAETADPGDTAAS